MAYSFATTLKKAGIAFAYGGVSQLLVMLGGLEIPIEYAWVAPVILALLTALQNWLKNKNK